MRAKMLIGFPVLLLMGCASLNDLVTSNVDRTTGMPSFAALQAAKVEQIVNGAVKDIKVAFDYGYQDRFKNVQFDAKAVKLASGYDISFAWKSPHAYFAPGEYDVLRNASTDARSGIAFLDLVATGVTEMANDLDRLGAKYELTATYEAQADGLPIRDSGLSYRNEYGEVYMPAEFSRLNGRPTAFRIRPHQRISNQELAALRAYSMKDFVDRAAGARKIKPRYDIKVSQHVGLNHRYCLVRLRLLER